MIATGRTVGLLWIVFAITRASLACADQQPQVPRMTNSPKAECESLMNSVLPFAEQMLTTHGEFIPFGGAMRSNGQIVSIAGYDGNEHPKSVNVIALMKEGIIAAARKGEYKASAIVYDVRVKLPSTDEKSDAIAVSLNHRDSYSVIVVFPYKIDRGKLTIGTAFAQKGEADIFPPL
jgi:hypothetical protein